MELGIGNILLAIGAGLASIASPCVLPVLPIVVTGTNKDNNLRPLLIVLGLSSTFILMGIVSSLFGSLIMGKMQYVEKVVAIIIILFGILLLFEINLFKRMYWLSNIQVKTSGKWSGLFLGLALGVIWIPCIGPMLSSILSLVAATGSVTKGVLFLSFYSLGFAMPILAVGYLSHYTRTKIQALQKKESPIRITSGIILIAFGIFLFINGSLIRF